VSDKQLSEDAETTGKSERRRERERNRSKVAKRKEIDRRCILSDKT
tara:strand:+ start:482 stop:619 length:138 start_codon:yes stop_codon:yes gene_type:complete